MKNSRKVPFLLLGESVVDLISTDKIDSLQQAACFQRYAGGQVSNLASNLVRLGYPAALGTCLGNDGPGRFLQDHLARTGVNLDQLQFTDEASTTLVSVARQEGTPDFNIYRGADHYLSISDKLLAAASESEFIHTSAFALSRDPCRSTILAILEANQNAGKTISLDPNFHPKIWPDQPEFISVLKDLFKYITITKPSLDDSIRIFGQGLEPIQYLGKFLDLGPEIVLLTMGSAGSLLGTDKGERIQIHPNPVKVVDVTGAGDAYWSGLLAGLYEGHSTLTAAKIGQAVAEYKIGFVGPISDQMTLDHFLDPAEKIHTSQK